MIKIGQIWKRKNGKLVRITAQRLKNGDIWELTPLYGYGGRKSWKWEGGIKTELELIEDVKEG